MPKLKFTWVICLVTFIINCNLGFSQPKQDTVVLGIDPSSCQSCIRLLPQVDSVLHGKHYLIQYYFKGIRRVEIADIINRRFKYVDSSQVLVNWNKYDSIYNYKGPFLLFKSNDECFTLEEFLNTNNSVYKIKLDETQMRFSQDGWFYPYRENLLYVNPSYLDPSIGIINAKSGNLEKLVTPFSDSMIKVIYRKVDEKNFKLGLKKRQDIINDDLNHEWEEMKLGPLSITKYGLYLWGSINVVNYSRNDILNLDIIFRLNPDLTINDYFIAKEPGFNNRDYCASYWYQRTFPVLDSETVVMSIFQSIYREKWNEYPLAKFKLINHQIVLDKEVFIKSKLLAKRKSTSDWSFHFGNYVLMKNRLFLYCNDFPFIYDFDSGLDLPLFSKSDFSNFDLNTEMNTLKYYSKYMHTSNDSLFHVISEKDISSNEVEFYCTIYDSDFRRISTQILNIDKRITSAKTIQVLGHKNNNYQIIEFSDMNTFYFELPIPNPKN